MSSFITNLFPASQAGKGETNLQDGFKDRPSTPNRSSFINPVQTPQGSPSKNQRPPGAYEIPTAFSSPTKAQSKNPPASYELPVAFDSALKLGRADLSSPVKQERGTPLSPGKSNALAVDDSYFSGPVENADESILHKSVASGIPVRKHGKENTPPSSRSGTDAILPQTQAALSRQEHYQREPPAQSSKKYNTQRGLTKEELAIINKPNVRRLANVTQLCKSCSPACFCSMTD